MSERKQRPYRIREILPYACHEAGHAVVGHVIGRLIEEVSIVPDRVHGYKGYCRFSEFMESANNHLQWQRGSANPEIVTVLYAGTVATGIICQKHGWEYKSWQDCDKADLEVVDRWCLEKLADNEQHSLVKEACLIQARDMLIQHWDTVDDLTAELVVHERLNGGEVHRIIRRTLREKGTDWRLVVWNVKE